MLVALIVTELVTAAVGGLMSFQIQSDLEKRLISKLAVDYGHDTTSDIPFSHSLDFAQYKVLASARNSFTSAYQLRMACSWQENLLRIDIFRNFSQFRFNFLLSIRFTHCYASFLIVDTIRLLLIEISICVT